MQEALELPPLLQGCELETLLNQHCGLRLTSKHRLHFSEALIETRL